MTEEKQNRNSAAKIKANNRYNAKAYDRVSVVLTKGRKQEIQQAAEQCNESLNAFIVASIDERMKRLSSGTEEQQA